MHLQDTTQLPEEMLTEILEAVQLCWRAVLEPFLWQSQSSPVHRSLGHPCVLPHRCPDFLVRT